MGSLRLSVIGAGWIGRKHAERIVASDECELVGICDLSPERKSIADELGACWDCDLVAMLERERPDGVVIATPNGSHVAIAETCAQHSAHLLIEKPIADTIENAHRINRAAEAAGVQVLVGHHRRHNPLISETRDVIQGGALGRLVAVSALWTLTKPADYYDIEWRTKRPGGGPTLINLIHELDSLRFICGEIDQVYALASSAVRGFEVEDSLSMTLSFANGVVGSVLASDTAAAPWSYEATTGENPHYFHADENCYHFAGTHGSLAFPRMELWQYADEGRRGWHYPLQKTRRQVAPADPLTLQLAHFCRVIRGEESPIAGGRDATRSLAVALAALQSMESRMPVSVPDISA
jgi:predicted dehydrogenase